MNLNSRWPHWFAVVLSFLTLFLVFVGALVTTTESGLAVPDWPLSYGRLMPPMIGGIFYEHGHRMVATFIGFLTILLALTISFKEKEGWLKKAGWIALGLVILQGLLGGLTVLLRLPRTVSILHACMAQAFLCLVVALSVWSSGFWKSSYLPRTDPKNSIPLHHITTGLFATAFGQLIMGAVLRHTGWGLIPHIAGAVLVTVLIFFSFVRIHTSKPRHQGLIWTSRSLGLALVAQIILGIYTYIFIGKEFEVIPPPFYSQLTISFHVVIGALILGLSVVLALICYKTRPHQTPHRKTKLKDYFELTKPGISLTAGFTALAGFVLGSEGSVNFLLLFHTSIGTLLVAGGACALNMLVEKDVDAQMKRTMKRPIPSGRLKPGEALFAGLLLSTVAIVYLCWSVNLLTACIAAITLSVYVYIYTPLKKVTSLCTGIGAVAGALPPVMGWTAATGQLGWQALILFGILFFWQFPHFFSLAWLYRADYQQAGLHMLPHIEDKGTTTSISMFANSIILLLISLLPSFIGLTGTIYFGTALFLGLWMTWESFQFLRDRSVLSARRVFFASLAYVPLLVISMVLNKIHFL